MNTERRSAFKKILASIAGMAGFSAVAAEPKAATPEKKCQNIVTDNEIPLFSGSTSFGNLVFIAGKGAHFDGDIKAHTDHVLKELEAELKRAGSSMDQVLKVNVYLADLADYKAMNEVFRGRFGEKPPVRTTVATYGGVPGASLVEMDCIAYKK
jgi:enamine deaminase RidA (YjgF/YER057c/UK114 family)